MQDIILHVLLYVVCTVPQLLHYTYSEHCNRNNNNNKSQGLRKCPLCRGFHSFRLSEVPCNVIVSYIIIITVTSMNIKLMFLCFIDVDTPVLVQPSTNALESATKGTTCICT